MITEIPAFSIAGWGKMTTSEVRRKIKLNYIYKLTLSSLLFANFQEITVAHKSVLSNQDCSDLAGTKISDSKSPS